MTTDLKHLYPKSLWTFFTDILSIPHPSKNEAKIVEYIRKTGQDLFSLETQVDAVGNVLIRKPAFPGYERRKGVILQSHLDMVPQKNRDTVHDFESEAINAYIDEGWVKANGTTLGADNGIGVAAVLAVLADRSIKHGPLEALFTVDEETGMTGAFHLQPGWLQGDILINLDSEDESELIIGCAGGINTVITFSFTQETAEYEALCSFQIFVSGLKGGHSGVDIHLGRGNANKILGRLLLEAGDLFGLRLSKFNGGSVRNAIPRESSAAISVKKSLAKDFSQYCGEFLRLAKEELNLTEPDLNIEVKEVDSPSSYMDMSTQVRFLKAIHACPDGVIGMSASVPGVVETSSNLAAVHCSKETITIETLQRSSRRTLRDYICRRIRCVFELAGAKVEHIAPYPGWKPDPDSGILNVMKDVYLKKFGRLPDVKVIHAGLESGLIGDMYPQMDLISCGPTIRFPHSPDEKVNIASVGRFWDFLKETLESIPE